MPIPAQNAATKTTHTSRALGWRGIVVETLLHPGGEFQFAPADDHHLCLNLGLPVRLEYQGTGRFKKVYVPGGFAAIVPAGQPSLWRHTVTVHHLHLYLSPALLAQTAEQMASGSGGTLTEINSVPFYDPHVEQIAHLLRLEAESGAPHGGLYAETLASALSVRLLQREQDFTRLPVLPAAVKVRTELRRAVTFIQDNLASDLSLDAIAQEAGLSSYHFARLFMEAFGVPPHQYIIQARIERAKMLITQNRLPLGEVAQHVGFSDQSHFNRHFKRLVGVTPRAFARSAAGHQNLRSKIVL